MDQITGLTPAVSIQQSAPARSARSTVGTATELHDHLRLLFARLGQVHCVKCGRPVTADSAQTIAREAVRWADDTPVLVLAPVVLSERLSWDEQAAPRAAVAEDGGELVPYPVKPPRGAFGEHVVDRFRWTRGRERLVEARGAFRRGERQLSWTLDGGHRRRARKVGVFPLRHTQSSPSGAVLVRSPLASAPPAAASATCSRSRPT